MRKETVNAKVTEAQCTGCGACKNVCPVSAISMKADTEGFLYPNVKETQCIECGKCLMVCPVLVDNNSNSSTPEIWAVRASDDLRAVSSSGGVFTILAEYILEEKGLVCGAAYDTEMNVHHMLVEKKEDLKKLRGSKYVQSDVRDVYQKIYTELKNGRTVLFTGTPCQNAALRNVVGEQEKLVQVDLICHGVPSQTLFTQYLSEVADGKKIKTVNFRNKQFGWQSGKVQIQFEDQSEYIGTTQNDPYEVGFYRNLTLQKCCSDCKFSEYPREGDLSIGDFWGISDIDRKQNDGKGTSIVFVNNQKGERVFSAIQKRFYKTQSYPFQEIGGKIKNRVHAKYPPNIKREKFFQELKKRHNVYQAVKETLPNGIEQKKIVSGKIFDVGLVSNYLAVNFGGSLTQYAMYRTIKKMGYSVGMIGRPLSSWGKADHANLSKMYLECPYDEIDLLPRMNTREDMEALNNVCRQFVVGSDQLFQYTLYRDLDKFVSLSWAKDRKKKIAYAASFGHGKIWGDVDELAEMGYFLNKYDAFSVREKDAVALCKRHFAVDAEWVLDPVFLCDKEVYRELAQKSKRKRKEHYIASYILDPSMDKQKILKRIGKELDLPIEVYSEMLHSKEYVAPLGDLDVVHLKVEERLDSIMNCDYFVTDSFHGTCFAIIMGKPFLSILNTKRGGSRFTSLLELFGLEARLIKNSKELEKNVPAVIADIDYAAVHKILEKEKQRCTQWLLTQLKTPKKNLYSDYDMMKKLIEEQKRTISQLHSEMMELARMVGKEGRYITDIEKYLDYLFRVRKKYQILIAVKDTPGLAVSENVSEKFQKLGIREKLVGKHGRSFAAVIDGGENIYEEMGQELSPIETELHLEDAELRLVSRVFLNGNEAVIKYNGIDYAVNERGFNIVLIEKESGIVEDSVCFDTHLPDYKCYRRK